MAESERNLSDRADPAARFIRLWSRDVLLQAHASEDSHFLVVPVIDRMRIIGWKIYHTKQAQLLAPNVDGCRDGVWESFNQARDWISATYYSGAT